MNVSRLSEAIEAERVAADVVGMAVALVHDGEVVLSEGYGSVHDDGRQRVSADTVFPIASATKAFTATLIGQLVSSGHLQWDTPLRKVLPSLSLADPLANEHLSIRDVLCHRSGLPPHEYMVFGDHGLTRETLVERLDHLPASAPFRSCWQYNNLLYVLAGHVAETLVGASWEEALRHQLLDPLGMTATQFTDEPLPPTARPTTGYTVGPSGRLVASHRPIVLERPAGGLCSSAVDLSAWLQFNLGGAKGSRAPLDATSHRELLTPVIDIPQFPTQEDLGSVSAALGWLSQDYRGHRLVWHSGGTSGFASFVGIVPETKTGVAVVCNADYTAAQQIAAYTLLDHALGLEPLPWRERFAPMTQALADLLSQRGQAASSPATHPYSHEILGVFAHPGYGTLALSDEGGGLCVSFHGAHRPLESVGVDRWTVEFESASPVEIEYVNAQDGWTVQVEPAVAPMLFKRSIMLT